MLRPISGIRVIHIHALYAPQSASQRLYIYISLTRSFSTFPSEKISLVLSKDKAAAATMARKLQLHLYNALTVVQGGWRRVFPQRGCGAHFISNWCTPLGQEMASDGWAPLNSRFGATYTACSAGRRRCTTPWLPAAQSDTWHILAQNHQMFGSKRGLHASGKFWEWTPNCRFASHASQTSLPLQFCPEYLPKLRGENEELNEDRHSAPIFHVPYPFMSFMFMFASLCSHFWHFQPMYGDVHLSNWFFDDLW
jgi:hypothetical protein